MALSPRFYGISSILGGTFKKMALQVMYTTFLQMKYLLQQNLYIFFKNLWHFFLRGKRDLTTFYLYRRKRVKVVCKKRNRLFDNSEKKMKKGEKLGRKWVKITISYRLEILFNVYNKKKIDILCI